MVKAYSWLCPQESVTLDREITHNLEDHICWWGSKQSKHLTNSLSLSLSLIHSLFPISSIKMLCSWDDLDGWWRINIVELNFG